MERFVKVCRRSGLRVNAVKNRVMVLGGEEELEFDVCVDGISLAHVSEFKYSGCVLDESDTDEAESSRNVASGRRVAGTIRFLVNVSILHESLLVLVLMYGSDAMM